MHEYTCIAQFLTSEKDLEQLQVYNWVKTWQKYKYSLVNSMKLPRYMTCFVGHTQKYWHGLNSKEIVMWRSIA